MTRLPFYFTIAGVVPFVLLSITISMRVFDEGSKMLLEMLLAYAAVIISFLGGIHWGLAITQYADNRKIANLLIIESVLPALIAWGTLFTAGMYIQLLVLTLLYTFMWAIDSLLYSNNILPQWFFNLRCLITPIVVVSLYVAYFGVV